MECNVVATHVSAAGQTGVDSPLPKGEGCLFRWLRAAKSENLWP